MASILEELLFPIAFNDRRYDTGVERSTASMIEHRKEIESARRR